MKFHFVFPYYDASPLSASSYRMILYASLPFKRQYPFNLRMQSPYDSRLFSSFSVSFIQEDLSAILL